MANTLSVYYQFRRFAGLLNTPNIAIKKYFSDNKTLEIQGTNEPTAAQRNEFDQRLRGTQTTNFTDQKPAPITASLSTWSF